MQWRQCLWWSKAPCSPSFSLSVCPHIHANHSPRPLPRPPTVTVPVDTTAPALTQPHAASCSLMQPHAASCSLDAQWHRAPGSFHQAHSLTSIVLPAAHSPAPLPHLPPAPQTHTTHEDEQLGSITLVALSYVGSSSFLPPSVSPLCVCVSVFVGLCLLQTINLVTQQKIEQSCMQLKDLMLLLWLIDTKTLHKLDVHNYTSNTEQIVC